MKPHIHLNEDSRYARVIVCGPPERAEKIAGYLENAVPLAKNREYHSYLGRFRGTDILVVSHGVGAPGAAICFQELIDVGAKAIVRVGSAGGLQEASAIGDTVVATGAIRKDGVTALMVPLQFPAVPDGGLTARIHAEIQSKLSNVTTGIVLTSDLFYPGLLDPELVLYQKAGAVAVEMECSALFITGSLRKVKTAAALVLDGNPLKWKDGDYAPRSALMDQAFSHLIPACLSALIKEDVS